MTRFTINGADLTGLRDKVVLLTGGSSGIGLATARLLLDLGAKVVMGDLHHPPDDLSSQNLTYMPLDVTNWKQLCAVFKKTVEVHGRIDHVFANAGVAPSEHFFEDEVDEHGDLLPPKNLTVNVNLLSVISTVKLALHYLRKQPEGGSIVLTASASSFQRFSAVDYTVAKHGVLGLMRGLYPLLHPHLPIRINALAPSWTATGMVPTSLSATGIAVQPPSAVAKSAAILMADSNRHGQLIFSDDGQYMEIEKAMLQVVDEITQSRDGMQSIAVVDRLMAKDKLKKMGVNVAE